MKKTISILAISILALTGLNISSAENNSDANIRAIIEVKPDSDINQILQKHNIKPKFVYKNIGQGFAGTIPAGLVKQLESEPEILSITPDRKVSAFPKPDKPGKPDKGGDTPPAEQTTPAGITRIGAQPGNIQYTGNTIGVAIVDTGIDYNHTDLNISSSSFTAYPEIGTTDGQDDQGHGTHVAGIVAALNNSTDTVGVAPDATLYPVKVLNSQGSGNESDVIAGLEWVLINHNQVSPAIKVVNMSLGREGEVNDSPLYRQAIQSLTTNGITVVVAAGNDQRLEVSQNIPAAYPEVIAVASATAENGQVASKGACAGRSIPQDTASYFTTDGPEVVISAPGARRENIKNNCGLTSEGVLSSALGGGTTRMSGTSMASPHVAGVAALLYEKNPNTTPEEIRAAIANSGSLIGSAPLDSPASSYSFDGIREGILNAPAALSLMN